MKSMIADQDKETSDEQTLSEEKDRFDDEKGKKSMGFGFQPYTAEHSCWNILISKILILMIN